MKKSWKNKILQNLMNSLWKATLNILVYNNYFNNIFHEFKFMKNVKIAMDVSSYHLTV